jgi:transcriptional regulator with XRE-family HTH domain
VAGQPALSVAGLLRQLRIEAKLTQEELAEAASVSPRSVSDLERGINRTARKDTARLLAEALGLAGTVADLFVAAARGRVPARDVLAARRGVAPEGFTEAVARTLLGDATGFTGHQLSADAGAGSDVRVAMLGGSAYTSGAAWFRAPGGCASPRLSSSCLRWPMATGSTVTCWLRCCGRAWIPLLRRITCIRPCMRRGGRWHRMVRLGPA